MNKEEQQVFYVRKTIEKLLVEEKQTKLKLENIQKTKLKCVRILLDDKYCKNILKEVSEWIKN